MDVTNQWPMCSRCGSPMQWADPCFICNCNIPQGSIKQFGQSHFTYVYAGPMKPRTIAIDPKTTALEEVITAVLKASHHGDQHFREFLKCEEAADLRAALVKLAEAARGGIPE